MPESDISLLEIPDDYNVLQPAPELAHLLKLSVDAKTRDIYLIGEITDDYGGEFLQLVRYLERLDRTAPVRVWISSPGGDPVSSFAIHDAIRSSPMKVVTIGIGEVASAANLILACGNDRYVTPSCCFMAHESKWGREEGGLGFSAGKDRRKFEDWEHEYWAELMGKYCKGGKSFWRGAVERNGELWLLGGQAIVEAGVADAIWTGKEA